jgi:hypothetical protein
MPVISFKVSAEHASHLRRTARMKHKTVSEYLRDTTRPETRLKHRIIIKKHPVSGLSYDASPDAIVATEEEIKAARHS